MQRVLFCTLWLTLCCKSIGTPEKSLLYQKCWLILIGKKQKKNFFAEKFQNGRLKKLSFSTTPKSWAITAKLSWIGPFISKIDWCKGHWWGTSYMAVRLSEIRPKTGKICIFCVFRPFLSLCWTASRPYRLSHTNAPKIAPSKHFSQQCILKQGQL